MHRLLHLFFATLALSLAMTEPASAQAPEPIRYTVRFPAAHTHYFEVEAVYPTGRRPQVELMMAVWTPGSYLVREYQRHVENLVAKADGKTLVVVKPVKNRWRIDTGGAASVTVTYRVYGREMTVRNNWVEAGFAMLNGAPTFITLAERTARAHEVRLELPAAWKGSATPLMPVAGQAHSYRAEDFDTLVDSPIIAGNPVVKTFEVDGKRHHLVLEGDPSLFDADRAAADVKKIVEAGKGVMGRLDYPHYFFLNMVVETGGGLEHKNAFLTMSSRYTTRTHRAYVNWLNLVGHEYFHNWNVKRLRPVELGPFDYETETYTKALWVAEGFTDYYGALLVARAGLSHAGRISRRAVEHHRAGADAARTAGAAGGHGLVRHLDQAVPPRREQPQHEHRLLLEGRVDCVHARRQNPQGHGRGQVARRRDARGLCALLGGQGLHPRAVLRRDVRGGWPQSHPLVHRHRVEHCRARLQRGARLLRAALHARGREDGARHARRQHPRRQRAARRHGRAARHPGARRRRQH